MRALIIDEQGIWRNGKREIVKREFKEINIPDNLILKLRTAYELLLEEEFEKIMEDMGIKTKEQEEKEND